MPDAESKSGCGDRQYRHRPPPAGGRAPLGPPGAEPGTTPSMATEQDTTHRQHLQHLQTTLGPHRDVLEALATLDNPLSEDAEAVLAILDDLD